MSFDLFKKIVDENNFEYISFTGWGEPLLHHSIADFVVYACEHIKEVSLPTNGTLPIPDRIIDSGLTRIKFSLHEGTLNKHIMDFLWKNKTIKTEVVKVGCFDQKVYDFWKDYVDEVRFQRLATHHKLRTSLCPVLGKKFYVWWNGNVSPCCMDYDCKLWLGNLEYQTLEEIVGGRPLSELLRHHKELDYPEVCAICGEESGGDLKYQLQ